MAIQLSFTIGKDRNFKLYLLGYWVETSDEQHKVYYEKLIAAESEALAVEQFEESDEYLMYLNAGANVYSLTVYQVRM